MTSEYIGEFAFLQAFGERFRDMRSEQKELSIFVELFNVEAADVPDNLKQEITEVKSNKKLQPASAPAL